MASTKEYRLLCLENPLLGKPTKFFFLSSSIGRPAMSYPLPCLLRPVPPFTLLTSAPKKSPKAPAG